MLLALMGLICAKPVPKPEGLTLLGVVDSQDGKNIKFALCPRADMFETQKHYKIMVEMPGVEAKNIHIAVECKWLYISGKKKQEVGTKDQKVQNKDRKEPRYTEFKRELLLPEDALTDGLQAKFKNHRLYITVPRARTDRRTIALRTQGNLIKTSI